jgi:hypothetical protein
VSDNLEAVKESPVMSLLREQKEIENAIRLYERMFGTIINGVYHEHCHSITYLKGRLDGIKCAMRTMDM